MKPKTILFDKNIPANVISHFNKLGYKTYIWGGDGFFTRTGPAFKLAKQAGINNHNIFWGKLSYVIPNNEVGMFMSSDDKYSELDGFVKWINNDNIELAAGDPVVQERWVTHPSETKSGDSCPICITLEEMGWVDQGASVTYMWDAGSKIINGLPEYRMAHSTIGDGNWKVGDSKCKCSKQFRMGVEQKTQLRVVTLSESCTIPHNQCQNHS